MTTRAQAGESRPSRRKKLFFAGIVAGLVVVCALPIAEVTLRILFCEEDMNGTYFAAGAFQADELTGFRQAGGFRGRAFRRGIFDCPVETQPNGLREANYAAQIAYPRKLLLLGDSFTFGLGVAEELTFASLIQPRLNAKGIGVVNGGQTAFCVEQEVAFGRRLSEQLDPAAIILCVCTENDVLGDYDESYKNVDVKYGCRLPKDRWLPIAPLDYLRTHSYLWMAVARAARKQGREERIPEYQRQAVFETRKLLVPTLAALTGFNDYCNRRGIRFGVVMIPPSERVPFDAPLKRSLKRAGIPSVDLAEKGFGPQHRFRATRTGTSAVTGTRRRTWRRSASTCSARSDRLVCDRGGGAGARTGPSPNWKD
jgi:hypothetical protein